MPGEKRTMKGKMREERENSVKEKKIESGGKGERNHIWTVKKKKV